jgi:hypothetical protein
VSVAAGDSDAAGDADGDGVALGSAAIALTHTKPISATKTRVVVINHHRIDDLSRNGADVSRGPHRKITPLASNDSSGLWRAQNGSANKNRKTSELFSDKFGHSNYVILGDSYKLLDLHFPL